MLETFKQSFKVKMAYRVNSIIYNIKRIPLIKKLIPYDVYANSGFKAIGSVFSISREILMTFFGKIIYLLILTLFADITFEMNQNFVFLNLFIFLSILGAFINNNLFNPSNDNYYAVILMRMNANKYAKSTYLYFILTTLVGFLPSTLFFGLTVFHLPLYICFMLPIYVLMVKMTMIGCNLLYIEKTKKYKNILNGIKTIIIAILLVALAVGLPLLEVYINYTVFYIFFIIFLMTGIWGLFKILNFNGYLKLYKETLKQVDDVSTVTQASIVKEATQSQIELNPKLNSNKSGYPYFHELFVKRHNKVLTKAVKMQSLIILGVFALVVLLVTFVPESRKEINVVPLSYLPYFVFLMYCLNRGTVLTQALFINCDHSMLTYRFYRRPNVILGLFKERLKTLIKLNVMPASIIALALPVILYITGGTNHPINYLILFVSIISMSVFFSVHYLVMYYLLQPYNANTELKSGTYKIVQALTYVVCYYMIQIKLPTLEFGLATIAFAIIYSVLALFLVYKKAPKTFRIRN